MDTLLWPITYWHWWIAAALLMAAELLVPGIYLIWLGLAAALTGLLAFATGLGWHGQVMLFAIFSVAAAALGRMVYVRSQGPSDHPTLNRRADQYTGRVFILDQPISGGVGRLKVADTTWKIRGADAPAGTRVRVVAADGVALRVEPTDES